MLWLLLRILIILVLVRIIVSAVRALQGPPRRRTERDAQTSDAKQIRRPPSRGIVDADFEDLDESRKR